MAHIDTTRLVDHDQYPDTHARARPVVEVHTCKDCGVRLQDDATLPQPLCMLCYANRLIRSRSG